MAIKLVLFISLISIFLNTKNAVAEEVTFKAEVTFKSPGCEAFIENVDKCPEKSNCRIKIKIGKENYSYTFATNGQDANKVCKVIYSDKESSRTYVALFSYSREQLKNLKDFLKTMTSQKSVFDLTVHENCCNKNEEAKEIKYCPIKINNKVHLNLINYSAYTTCGGKKIDPNMIYKEFKYDD